MIERLARIYIGVYYPLDILGSLVVSLISAGIVISLARRFKPLNALVYRVENWILQKNP
ncbi:hypothetical protein [Nitratifractor sp.]